MKPALLLAATLLATAAFAQDEKGKPAPPKRPAVETKRGIVFLAHGVAKETAKVLASYFQGDADIHPGPDGAGNCLLVSAPTHVFDDVVATIERLDRRAQSIVVDVLIVELHSKTPADKAPDSKELAGPFPDVSRRLESMVKEGRLVGLKQFQFSAVEGQQATMSLTENKPYAMGAMTSGRGNVSTPITYRNIGTQVRVSPLVMGDGSIKLDLNIEDSRARDSSTASVGKDEKGAPIQAADFIQTSLTAKVSVPPGQAVVANHARTISSAGQGQTLIVVAARTK